MGCRGVLRRLGKNECGKECGRKSMRMKMGMVEENMRVNVDESESVCGRIGMREKARMRTNVYKIEGG